MESGGGGFFPFGGGDPEDLLGALREFAEKQAESVQDAQREQYRRALARWGLVDRGVSWSVAHSGWRIARR